MLSPDINSTSMMLSPDSYSTGMMLSPDSYSTNMMLSPDITCYEWRCSCGDALASSVRVLLFIIIFSSFLNFKSSPGVHSVFLPL